MSALRQRMTEDMQLRNLALNTQISYLLQVSCFARHFGKSPAELGEEEIRAYQIYLTRESRVLPGLRSGGEPEWLHFLAVLPFDDEFREAVA